jgi:hypothetical protein
MKLLVASAKFSNHSPQVFVFGLAEGTSKQNNAVASGTMAS